MSAQMGRPPKDAKDRRTDELRIRLTPGERAALDAAANGENTSTWARSLLLAATNRRKNKKPDGPV